MPTEEKHEIKMMYAVYADGRKEPIVIDEIKDLSLEEAEPILEEHNFVKVVRCKDCKYGEVDDMDFPTQIFCHYNGDDWNEDNHYCSYGERRKDAEIH